MRKDVLTIELKQDMVDLIQAYYEDYRAKQDLITMIFELHKYDEDDSIINSVPFKGYEKKFVEAKVKYDTAMTEVRNNLIPQEYNSERYQFEIDFDTREIRIFCNL